MSTNTAPQIIKRADLPLHCPTPEVALWSEHPKVFLEIETEGHVTCPYCGTHFVLENHAKAK